MARGPSDVLVKAVERLTGESADELRRTTIDERRRLVEQARGRRVRFMTHFPFIGRGNIMHGRLIKHDEVEAAVCEALK